ncbi:MAG: DEAD/DEAH box helicase [Bacteroidales bacterium]|jgi:ATP-dependent RNA helicase RhlE|nr:DEAD/DEAH box helicase [Bacteroidales bacterium]
MDFSELGLSNEMVDRLSDLGMEKPFAVQEKIIPLLSEEKDVIGIADTGSGKTAAFAIPVIERLKVKRELKNRQIRVLVMTPTRELAVQVAEVFRSLSVNLSYRVKVVAAYGGVSINPQMMKMNGAEIVVATPGRLLDLCMSNALSLSEVETLIIDEADKMLSMGFADDMNQIFDMLPAKKQTALFSATLSDKVQELTNIVLRNPEVVKIETKPEGKPEVVQCAYVVSEEQKGPFLRYLIKREDMGKVIVFVSSGRRADLVSKKLNRNGINALPFHGDKSQGARTDALIKFKNGKVNVLVATDLASRGIDIDEMPYVINYELPRSPKDYIHRIGRTARGGAGGNAITIITSSDMHHFRVIQNKIGKRIAMVEADDIDLKGY